MGNPLSRPTAPVAASSAQPRTALSRWQSSPKQLPDLLQYLESQQSQLEQHRAVCIYIAMITNRQKLHHTLWHLEQYLLDAQQCRLPHDHRRQLICFTHDKLANLFFIWHHLHSGTLTPAHLHDRLLPEMHAHPYTHKLQYLYEGTLAPQSLTSASLDTDTLVRQAVKVNYPHLVTQQTLGHLFQYIVREHVFVEDTLHFGRFVGALVRAARDGACREYWERLVALRGEQESLAGMERHEGRDAAQVVVEAAGVFLDHGYPYAMELIFDTLRGLHGSKLTPAQARLQLETKIYGLLIYYFEELGYEFRQVQQLKTQQIIHVFLKQNNMDALAKLRLVYSSVGPDACDLSFQTQLLNYVFSTKCTLSMALQIVTSPLDYLPMSSVENQYRLVRKLNESKLQVIIENQNHVKEIVVGLLSDGAFGELREKIDEILQICRLVYMFGVNQKFGALAVFYYVQEHNEGTTRAQAEMVNQQKALHFFKAFISKFYISADRSKKIQLSPKSSSQLQVDLSKPEAIFQLSHYMYDKFLGKGLHSQKQLHQIIFQHMIYFYKYEDARAILSNTRTISKFEISIETLQMIVIENIVESIRKSTDTGKIINDITQQFKLIKDTNTVQCQSARAMIELVRYLHDIGVELPAGQKDHIGVGLMEWIADNYSDRIDVINFDSIYREIRAINEDQLIDEDTSYMMTNDLLRFKSKLAAKAFQVGKRKLGNDLIDEISRFSPPWLTTELIQIFKSTTATIDKRVFGIALKACSKGSDLQYLMQLWRQQQGKQRQREKGFGDITEYFETGRQYLVIDDSLIRSEQQYRNYVAECQFNDASLHFKKYELFFVLLGTEHQQAFHYALKVQLDPIKIEIFLREGMKNGTTSIHNCTKQLHKYLYFASTSMQQSLGFQLTYREYLSYSFDEGELRLKLQAYTKTKQKTTVVQVYYKILAAYLSSLYLSRQFISTYFPQPEHARSNYEYELLYDDKSRKSMLIELRQQPMGKSDIYTLNQVCREILNASLMDLCMFSLCNIANTSESLSQKSHYIMQKIITLTLEREGECREVVAKLVDKVFSMRGLFEILLFLRESENVIYGHVIKERNLHILQALATVEQGQQFHGLIPADFFQKEVEYQPRGQLSKQHQKVIRKCWNKTNIFVVSKVVYFVYGMDKEVEKKVWAEYLQQNQDDELMQIKLKLERE